MKKVSILSAVIVATGIGLFALHFQSNAQEMSNIGTVDAGQMTMTLQPESVVNIGMAGSGTFTIDWGDGTTSETHTLKVYNGNDEKSTKWMQNHPDIKYEDEYLYSHDYSGTLSHVTITIAGENITFLGCAFLKLTSLDISGNTMLKYLHCSNNQLTNLDVSKNIALTHLLCDSNPLKSIEVSKNTELTYLNCSANQLTSLDVNKNTALIDLWCAMNELTFLDVRRNTALKSLFCFDNHLSTGALVFLFEALNENGGYKKVEIGHNPGEANYQNIATNKGWKVSTFF